MSFFNVRAINSTTGRVGGSISFLFKIALKPFELLTYKLVTFPKYEFILLVVLFSYTLFGSQPFQMPKLNPSPTCNPDNRTNNHAHFNGGGPPRALNHKSHSLGRTLPQTPPPPPAPSHGGQIGGKLGGAIGNITGLFNRCVASTSDIA